jgi:hypothetical protein
MARRGWTALALLCLSAAAAAATERGLDIIKDETG